MSKWLDFWEHWLLWGGGRSFEYLNIKILMDSLPLNLALCKLATLAFWINLTFKTTKLENLSLVSEKRYVRILANQGNGPLDGKVYSFYIEQSLNQDLDMPRWIPRVSQICMVISMTCFCRINISTFTILFELCVYTATMRIEWDPKTTEIETTHNNDSETVAIITDTVLLCTCFYFPMECSLTTFNSCSHSNTLSHAMRFQNNVLSTKLVCVMCNMKKLSCCSSHFFFKAQLLSVIHTCFRMS